MKKGEAIERASEMLGYFPDVYTCVACGLSKPIKWEVQDSSYDESSFKIEIEAGGNLTGWCGFSGDSTCKPPKGLHCPTCTEVRRSKEMR